MLSGYFFLYRIAILCDAVCRMNVIHLNNTTGKRKGRWIRYEFGKDLFGFFYYDVFSGRSRNGRRLKTRIFADPADFLCSLDIELYNSENRNYVP